MQALLRRIAACTICAEKLPHPPRPIVQGAPGARLIIIGQAPGAKVHASGVPWKDASGDLLRDWLQISADTFYDPGSVALLPMGFCYPGKGKQGDLPPRPECAPQWHESFLSHLKGPHLILLIGQYAQGRYLGEGRKPTLTENVRAVKTNAAPYFALPHPSPRNRIWLKKNEWFTTEVLPELRRRVREALGG